MNLHDLAPAPGSKRVRRRVGRGHGSGRVKTAGAGTKGQNARSGGGVKPFFEGGQNPWTMRIPHRRGFNNRRFRVESQVVNLGDLERIYQAGDNVTLESLKERGLIRDGSGKRPVKVLGNGSLSKQLTLQVHAVSASVRAAVEQAGGTLDLLRVAEPAPEGKKQRRRAKGRADTVTRVAAAAEAAAARRAGGGAEPPKRDSGAGAPAPESGGSSAPAEER